MDEYCLSTEDRKKALDAKFKEFVEALLSHREASFLDTFLIKILDQDGCSDLVSTCVSYAMKFNPRVFSMETFFIYTEISACIFSCESIEELSLGTSCNFPKILDVGNLPKIPEVVNLPRIKRLELKHTQLDDRCITRLFSGCPVLEDVSLERCFGELSCIFSQKLKYLSLRYCLSFPHSKRLVLSRFSVEPKISIRRAWPFTIEFVWKTLYTIAVGNTFSFIQNLFRCLKLDDYFGGLSDATVLRLHSQDMMSTLEAALPKLRAFHNLMDLNVGSWCMTCNFNPVALFLQQTPNLHKIALYMCARHCRGEETDIHQLMDNLMWMDFSRCKKLKLCDKSSMAVFLVVMTVVALVACFLIGSLKSKGALTMLNNDDMTDTVQIIFIQQTKKLCTSTNNVLYE
ncbi:F-box protein [Carex littledalei]|uniref:F-box protein n=1 Tax=Carex littledalei TaxID=544730 RepID=A0A833VA33_9POAL|nr:F-box protein [Carex littledalei]